MSSGMLLFLRIWYGFRQDFSLAAEIAENAEERWNWDIISCKRAGDLLLWVLKNEGVISRHRVTGGVFFPFFRGCGGSGFRDWDGCDSWAVCLLFYGGLCNEVG